MELKDIVAISGLSGLYEIITQRPDGMIVRPLDEGQSKFVSSRIHVFTPLDGITIYTDTDNIELSKVLPVMKKQEKENPPVEIKSNNEAFKEYFKKILPGYDEERVYVSDIKKVIKWYSILDAHGLVKVEEEKKEKSDKGQETSDEGQAASGKGKGSSDKRPEKASGKSQQSSGSSQKKESTKKEKQEDGKNQPKKLRNS